MQALLHRIASGEPVVLDNALGAGLAAGVLQGTKRLVAAGVLCSDTVYAAAGVQLLTMSSPTVWASATTEGSASGRGDLLIRTLYSAMPGLWDSFRLVAWLQPGSAQRHRGTEAIDAAIVALRTLLREIGDAEARLSIPLGASWPASGLAHDPQGALLSVSGFNGTRYALHTDSGARATRKLTLIYYPRFEPPWRPGDGGELRVLLADGSQRLLAPRADRLVLFESGLQHEVLPSRVARISLTVWGLGRGARQRPPPSALDLSHRCTSDMCQVAQRRKEAAQREQQARRSAELAHALLLGVSVGRDAWWAAQAGGSLGADAT